MRIKQATAIAIAGLTVGLAGLDFGVANAVTSTATVYKGCVEGNSRTMERLAR